MNTSTTKRQQIIELINTLPEESLSELISFVNYLRYKSTEKHPKEPSVNFLLSVAGLGTSIEENVSERDEEILSSEVDPIRGWSLHSDEQV
ncbi:hypothetical protein NIES4075_55450 [Tolypothrix sp. NIES-4075]|uniref:DUF2281 domain-containing protein n=1 Tax=Tolypothrix sp. NIES-4075 TaxID=2005459 RepID=UPI000B5C2551|nr:DUF2281 domain-containing protein [Tolypothrix sp. NIES-4075]GAX44526.1 hypothetical protein NIES4075_55450 [Tolypothrix sp. NIES-4075]